MSYTILNDYQDIPEALECFREYLQIHEGIVAVDTETTALRPQDGRLRLLTAALSNSTWIFDLDALDHLQIQWLWQALAGQPLVGHNMVFDLPWMMRRGFKPGEVTDTLLLSRVIHAGEPIFTHNLAACAERELGIPMAKDLQRSDWSGDLTEEQLQYAAHDAEITRQLYHVLWAKVQEGALETTAQIESRCLPAVAWMALAGVGIDVDRWKQLAFAAMDEAVRYKTELNAMLPPEYASRLIPWVKLTNRKAVLEAFDCNGIYFDNLQAKTIADYVQKNPRTYGVTLVSYLDNYRKAKTAGDEEEAVKWERTFNLNLPESYVAAHRSSVNWASTQQVQAVFASIGSTLPNADENTLSALDHPLAALILKYKDAAKRAGYASEKWLSYTRGSRIYPSWKQMGADTGRFSCAEPNLQQIDRDPAYRRCFVAAPGNVLVKCDYSMIEARLAAKIAGEERMQRAFESGEDIHKLTASLLLSKPVEQVTKAERQIGKSALFGLLYGMGAPKLRIYARTNFGVHLTDQEADHYRAVFFSAYPRLRYWHSRAGNDPRRETRTIIGRRRLGILRFTEKLNTPVQGSGADGLKIALALLWERRATCPGAIPVIVAHDEIVVEAPEAQAEPAQLWLETAMMDAMQGICFPVPVAVESRIARSWGGDPDV